MSLDFANSISTLTFQQSQAVPGFDRVVQGPDSFTYGVSFNIDPTLASDIFVKQYTIPAAQTQNIDLQNITDVFNNPMTFTRAYALQIGVVGIGQVKFSAGDTNPFDFFFDAGSAFTLNTNTSLSYSSNIPYAVTSSAKTLKIINESNTTEVVVQIAIVGGQGAGTTTTTTTTAVPTTSTTSTSTTSTTTSSTTSTTAAPLSIVTSSPLPSGTNGSSYSFVLQASGGVLPYINWTVTNGAMPGGLTLQSNSGGINGVITGSPGVYNFEISVSDSNSPQATVSKPFAMTVN